MSPSPWDKFSVSIFQNPFSFATLLTNFHVTITALPCTCSLRIQPQKYLLNEPTLKAPPFFFSFKCTMNCSILSLFCISLSRHLSCIPCSITCQPLLGHQISLWQYRAQWKTIPLKIPSVVILPRSTLQINLSSEIASSQLQTRLTKINELARCRANALRWEWEWQTGEASERPVGQEEKVRGRSEGWGLEWSQFTLELLTLRATTQRSRGLLKSFKPSGSQGVQGCPQGTLGKSGDNFVF